MEMKAAFKNNKELQIHHIEGLQDDLVDFMVSWHSSTLPLASRKRSIT